MSREIVSQARFRPYQTEPDSTKNTIGALYVYIADTKIGFVVCFVLFRDHEPISFSKYRAVHHVETK
jgi:hypothetical protein